MFDTAQECIFYKPKKLKMDMMFENSFKKFKCFLRNYHLLQFCHKVPQFSQIGSTCGSFKGFRPFLGKKHYIFNFMCKIDILTNN